MKVHILSQHTTRFGHARLWAHLVAACLLAEFTDVVVEIPLPLCRETLVGYHRRHQRWVDLSRQLASKVDGRTILVTDEASSEEGSIREELELMELED